MKIVAITTTKTSRAQNAREFWLSDYGNDYDQALAAAREAHPRKKKFFHLKSADGWKMTAEEFKVS